MGSGSSFSELLLLLPPPSSSVGFVLDVVVVAVAVVSVVVGVVIVGRVEVPVSKFRRLLNIPRILPKTKRDRCGGGGGNSVVATCVVVMGGCDCRGDDTCNLDE